jgi:hypothetical protein
MTQCDRRETNPRAREVFHDQAKLPRISAHTLATHSRRRAKPAGVPRCWFREASLRELLPARAKWKFVLGHLQPVLGERQPVSFSRSVEQFPACSTQALARARNFSTLEVGGAFGIVIHISPPSIFKAQKFQLFLPAAGSARYRLSPQSIV